MIILTIITRLILLGILTMAIPLCYAMGKQILDKEQW